MSRRLQIRSEWQPSTSRVVLAALLGHYAAAYGFCTTLMLFAFLSDLWSEGPSLITSARWDRVVEAACTFPVVTAFLGLWGALLISPSLLLTIPLTKLAARRLETGVLPTMALGIAPGLLAGLVVFGVRARSELMFLVPSATGGAAFAGIVWLVCIRPRQARGSTYV